MKLRRRRSAEIFGAMVVLILLAACGREDGSISHVVVSSRLTPHFSGAPTTHTLEVEFTMPRAFRVQGVSTITMTDTAGRTWPAMQMSLSENDERQRIGAKFEVAEDSSFGIVHIGDLDVDVMTGRVTRRATSGTPRSP